MDQYDTASTPDKLETFTPEEGKRESWRAKCKTFFREEASLHGIRYVFLQSSWLCRRFIWFVILITAITIFIYLNTINLIKYLNHPQKVAIDVSVKSSLNFPAVTICNYNKHRFSKVSDLGLFDALFTKYDTKLASTPVKGSWYKHRPDLCVYSEAELQKALFCNSNLTADHCAGKYRQYQGVSSLICEALCGTEGNSRLCNGFWYNRTSFKCYLTTALMKEPSQSDTQEMCKKESLEYYERKFILETPSFRCTFDGNNCEKHLKMSTDHGESFVVKKATKEVPDYSSMRSNRGKYLGLFETKRRPGHKATFTTHMSNFENSCLEFYYRFLGEGETTLMITVLPEHKSVETIGNLNGSVLSGWQKFYERIPNGPGVITFQAKRSEDLITTGLLLDNIGIESCDKYRANCLRDKHGTTYEGDIGVTKSGHKCAAKPHGRIPTLTPYCRNPDDDIKTWCYVDNATVGWEHCEIPQCACEEDEFLCESQGICIPKSLTCDGQVDCKQREDEKEVCASKMSLTCDFSKDFVCGYSNPDFGTLVWQRVNSREIFADNGPKEDSRGDQDGYFLYVDTQPGEEGTEVIFWSPKFQLLKDKDLCLRFDMRSVSEYSLVTKLELVLYTENISGAQTKVANYDLTKNIYTEWNKYTVRLPPTDTDNEYLLGWTYTMGLPFYSNIAIDNVHILDSCTESSEPNSTVTLGKAAESLICDFADPGNCTLEFYGKSSSAIWKWAPRDVWTYAFVHIRSWCTAKYAIKGTFKTPFFPSKQTFVRNCLGRIKGPRGSKIKLTFFKSKFTVQQNCTADFVKIREKTTSMLLLELCGQEPHEDDSTFIIEKDEIRITAQTLEGQMAFHGGYEILDTPKERALILYDEIEVPDRTSAGIYTQLLGLTHIHCLTMDAIAKTNISISLNGRTFLRLKRGVPRHITRQTVPAGNYNLAIHAEFSGRRETLAVVKEIKLEQGWCPLLYDTGNITCEFKDNDICGYQDFSIRVHWEAGQDGIVVQSLGLSKKTAQNSNLVSPKFIAEKMSCIRIDLSSTCETRLQVSVFGSSDIFDLSNAEFFEIIVSDTKNQTFTVPVRKSAKRAMFTVQLDEKNKNLTLHSITLLSDTRACSETSYVIKMQGQVDSGMKEYMASLSTEMAYTKPTPSPALALAPEIQLDDSLPKGENKSDTHSRRNFTAYFNVHDLSDVTAHQLEDMVFSCKFNNEKCDIQKDFIRERTNYGVCYTFNPGRNSSIKETTIPGSTHGLRLVLNIETYENMKGLKNDDGIKIHIHDQNDIPYVQYVGKAAALAQHTYFEISRQDLKSMKPPHGQCDSRELSLYPNATYTRYRCNQECESKAWLKQCGCIDHYMSGSDKYCTHPEWEECRAKINAGNFNCDCPTACETTTYPSQSSASSLAVFGVSQYLLEKEKIEKIQKNLDYVLNKEYKMMPAWYEMLEDQLRNVWQTLRNIQTFVGEQSINKETSRFSLILRTLSEFYRHTEMDIKMLQPTLNRLHEEADCLRRINDMQDRCISETLENLVFLRGLFRSTYFRDSGQIEEERLHIAVEQATRQIMTNFMIQLGLRTTVCYDSPANITWLGDYSMFMKNPDYIQIELKRFQVLGDQVTINRTLELVSILQPGNTPINQYVSNINIKDAVDKLEDYVRANFSAFREYNVFYVTSLNKGIKEVNDIFSVEQQKLANPDYTTESEIIKTISTFNMDYVSNFMVASSSCTELVRNLTYEQFDVMADALKKSTSMFKKRILDGLNTEIYQHGPSTTYVKYMAALSAIVSNVYPLVSETVQKNLTDTVKNMGIWRKPSANIDSDAFISYDLDERSLSKIWRDSLDLADFQQYKAPGILRRNIGQFYRQLGQELYELEVDIENQIDAFRKAYMTLNSTIESIAGMLTVDEFFILKNFLKVDVFYGELVHDVIEASAAYELLDFFNGIGGYFGLLLGASCITLIEFLDLIVYNIYLQCYGNKKKKKKQSTANGKENTTAV